MINDAQEELKSAIAKAHEALKRDLARLRTGRANPDLLDSIRVDYYGSISPLKQLATIAVPEPRMLTVKPFDKSQVKAVEKAIVQGDLGLNPQTDGDLIRIPMPMLTEERRKELVKVARKNGEECKIAIRKARHDAKDILEALKKEGDASEDDVERAMKKVEEIVQEGGNGVDKLVAKKEEDIMQV